MEIFLVVLMFVGFSLLSDKIEGKKKKESPEAKPKKAKPVNRPESTYVTEITEAMPIKLSQSINLMPDNSKELNGSVSALSPSLDSRKIKQEDVNTDILLHAVAYAQILQPPKAYQYIATRSCRGDWMNNK